MMRCAMTSDPIGEIAVDPKVTPAKAPPEGPTPPWWAYTCAAAVEGDPQRHLPIAGEPNV